MCILRMRTGKGCLEGDDTRIVGFHRYLGPCRAFRISLYYGAEEYVDDDGEESYYPYPAGLRHTSLSIQVIRMAHRRVGPC
jgi:hypothetical protein